MSLDISLIEKGVYPCPHCGQMHESSKEVYEANITHNLGKMANEVGIYEALWKPRSVGVVTGDDLAGILEVGIQRLESSPEYYKAFDMSNDWGTYDQFVPWLKELLEACKKNPDAVVISYV